MKRLAAIAAAAMFTAGLTVGSTGARADVTCYDFTSQAEAQEIYDALGGDVFGIDSGWPPPSGFGSGDQEAGNGIPCDAEIELREPKSPGNEPYKLYTDTARNGLSELPDVELEDATIAGVQYAEAIQTVENPAKLYVLMGIATPEFEIYADYEGYEVPGQCGSFEATTRLQQLLAPGTQVWLEIDEAGFFTQTMLDRHIWIQLDGRYRLISEILVSEGHAVVATERPGTGRADAKDNPPPTAKYRDALRKAQGRAIKAGVGLWTQCKVA